MKDEIIGGLRNALERGTPLEQAVRSFINAGYNPVEVREAAAELKVGSLSLLGRKPFEQEGASSPKIPSYSLQQKRALQPAPPVAPAQPPRTQTIEPKSIPRLKPLPALLPTDYVPPSQVSKTAVVALILLLLLLVAGLIVVITFRENLVDFILKSYAQ